MSLAHKSVATIKSPEFINLTPLDINPLMSACEIKVFYLGKNRNRSFISKETAMEMAKTLRGAPIVGYYKTDKEDFTDHGEEITIDGDGVHFKNNTKPYGFVAPNAQVWFKDFEEEDDFGNSIIRTYLMTTGYLWTGQFEQAKKVFEDDGKPHSMELEKETLQGHWATDPKSNIEFFIINDAIFEKLCILGETVEPCFEGSGVTQPEVSSTFSLDENFKHTLFTMMEELKYALEGGNTMAKTAEVSVNEPEVTTVEPEVTTEFTENQVNENESSSSEQEPSTDFKKEDEEDKKEKENSSENEDKKDEESQNQGGNSSEKDDDPDDDDDDKKKKEKFTVLEQEYQELQSSYASLKEEVEELRTFKKTIEDKQKDDLIKDFYMLSEEDKKDVIEHKSEYSLEDIKSKLAVICFEKKVNFNLGTSSENEESIVEEDENPVTTFDIKATEDSTVPEWVKAVESAMNGNY